MAMNANIHLSCTASGASHQHGWLASTVLHWFRVDLTSLTSLYLIDGARQLEFNCRKVQSWSSRSQMLFHP